MRNVYNKGLESLIKVYLKLVKQSSVEITNMPPSPSVIDSEGYLYQLFEYDEQNDYNLLKKKKLI
jgi:hypothetical protein